MRPPHHDDDRRFLEDDPRNMGRPPFWGPPPMMRKHLLRHGAFKEMQTLILLTKIEEQSKIEGEAPGITGSQLQNLYDLPRGTLMRILTGLEEGHLIQTEKAIINDRANKLYTITDDGQRHLEELRQKWAARNEAIDELAPFERYGRPWFGPRHHPHRPSGPHHGERPPSLHGKYRPPFRGSHHDPASIQDDLIETLLNRLEVLPTQEEAIDFLKGHRSRLTQVIHRLDRRQQEATTAREKIDELIEKVAGMHTFSAEELEKLFKA